jgi:hypothetical protein
MNLYIEFEDKRIKFTPHAYLLVICIYVILLGAIAIFCYGIYRCLIKDFFSKNTRINQSKVLQYDEFPNVVSETPSSLELDDNESI